MTTTKEETEIRRCVDSLASALRAKDINAVMAHYAPDVRTFDLGPPLQVQGIGYRKNFETWFASVRGPIDYKTRDLQITKSCDVAFCHSLNHVRSTGTTGEKADYWVRVTSGLRKTNDGHWLITHEHVSLPVDMATLKATLSSPA